MATALLRGLAEGGDVPLEVTSAGFGPSGVAVHPGAVKAMSGHPHPVQGHLSTRVTTTVLTRADLVVTMERRHVLQVVALSEAVWPRTFALRDLVQRAEEVGPRRREQSASSWLHALHTGRLTADTMPGSGFHDIADPTGGPRRGYVAVRDDLEALLGRFLLLLQGREPALPVPRRAGLLRRRTAVAS